MELTMRISEFEWREADHNQFSGRTSSIYARGRVWSHKQGQKIICSSGTNLAWFYSNVSDELQEIITETNQLVIDDLMDRNVIPKHWPKGLMSSDDLDEYPFQFNLKKTVLVDPEWTLHDEDAAQQSYVEMSVYSKDHGGLDSICKLELPEEHIRKAFDLLDEII